MQAASTKTAAPQSPRYDAGLKYFSERKFRQATAEFKAVIAEDPANAKAHFHIGRVLLETYWAEDAIQWFKHAVALEPGFVQAWLGWAEAIALGGDTTSRNAFLAELKTAPIASQHVVQLQDRFGALRAGSRPKTGGVSGKDIARLVAQLNKIAPALVEVEATKLLKRAPKSAAVANILAEAQARQGKTAAAFASLKMAIKLDARYAEAYLGLGQLLYQQNRPLDAANALRPAVILAPDMVPALAGLGVVLTRLGHFNAGLQLLERAAGLDPKNPVVLEEYGDVLLRRGEAAAAIKAYTTALAIYGDETPNHVRVVLADAYSQLGQDDTALDELDRVLENDPDNTRALTAKASILQAQGDFPLAEAQFRKAVEAHPTNGDAYRRMMLSHKATKDDPIIQEMIDVFERDDLSDNERMNLGFGLSKALEDAREDDRVFKYLNAANRISAQLAHASKVGRFADIRDCRESYSAFDFETMPEAPKGAVAPIFVTGMPRSGTTLVEQIIAAHSDVESGGELGYASAFVRPLLALTPGGAVNEQDPEMIANVGRNYVDAMEKKFPGVTKITDKSIYTFQHIGPLMRALPNAKFIVVRRDPRDNLLSMYKNKFNEGVHGYANEMEALAEFYDEFDKTIAFWRERVPDWFYEVSYDALVNDPEVEARKLIDAAGLDWEDNCLNFHKKRGNVKTLSVYQVRQPINKGSVNGWKRFEADLEPMLARLRSDGHITD